MNCRTMCMTLILLLTTAACLRAQVPVPSQLASKSVFLGNGPNFTTEGSNSLYTDVYQALGRAGYTLKAAPAEADLDIEVSFSTNVTGGLNPLEGVNDHLIVRLALYDTKTHSLLWVINAPCETAARKVTLLKNMEKAVGDAVTMLTTLASGKLPEVK